MTKQTWTLFDQSTGTREGYDQFGTNQNNFAEFSVRHGGVSDGVEVVSLDNGRLQIDVLPTRGMNLWQARFRGEDGSFESIGWKSPTRGPVHPKFVALSEPSGLGWLDGFDELLARCGLESNGAPEHDANGQLKFPLHGRISNKPAYKVELSIDESANDGRGEIRLTGWVEETRLHFLKVRLKSTIRTTFNSSSFEITDEITNLSASPAEIQMLYHINIGKPLLDAGSRIVAAVDELVPRNEHAAGSIENWDNYDAETPGYEEQVYFAKLLADTSGQTRTLLKNAHGTRGTCIRFDTQQLPCFTLWKNTTAGEDGYVTGLEPGTNFPNPRSFEGEHGRTIKLPANGSVALNLGFDYCANETAVTEAEASINQLQVRDAKVHRRPLPDWCS